MIEPYKKKALTRLKRAKGQIDGIIKMIEEDKYCGEILTQILALQGAVRGVAPLLIESHLHTCGEKKLTSKDPKVKEDFIRDIIRVCELSSR